MCTLLRLGSLAWQVAHKLLSTSEVPNLRTFPLPQPDILHWQPSPHILTTTPLPTMAPGIPLAPVVPTREEFAPPGAPQEQFAGVPAAHHVSYADASSSRTLLPGVVPVNERPMNDKVWAGMLAVAHVAIGAMAVIGLAGAEWDPAVRSACSTAQARTLATLEPGQTGLDVLGHYVWLAPALAVAAMGLAAVWLKLLQRHSLAVLRASIVAVLVASIGLAVLFIVSGSVAGVLMLIGAVLFGAIMYCYRHHLPITAMLLQVAATVTKKFPCLIGVAGGMGLLTLVYWAVAGVAVVALQFNGKVQAIGSNACEWQIAGYARVMQVLVLVGTLWCVSTISMARLHITAFMTAGHYFGQSTTTTEAAGKEQGPRMKDALRATWRSTGSLAVAGAILAAVQLMRRAVNEMERRAGSGILGIVRLVLLWILRFMLSMVESLNSWLVAAMAMTGLPARKSGKRAWRTVKHTFFQGMVDTDLCGLALHASAVALAWAAGAAVWLLLAMNFNVVSESMTLLHVLAFALLTAVPFGALTGGIIAAAVATGPAVPWAIGLLAAGLTHAVCMFVGSVVLDAVTAAFLCYAVDLNNARAPPTEWQELQSYAKSKEALKSANQPNDAAPATTGAAAPAPHVGAPAGQGTQV